MDPGAPPALGPRAARTCGLSPGTARASPSVSPLAATPTGSRTPRTYADTWLAHVVLPALNSDELWAHPLVAATFDNALRDRLLAAAAALPSFLDEHDDIPLGTHTRRPRQRPEEGSSASRETEWDVIVFVEEGWQ